MENGEGPVGIDGIERTDDANAMMAVFTLVIPLTPCCCGCVITTATGSWMTSKKKPDSNTVFRESQFLARFSRI
jgi:hypothetical protein